MHRRFLLIQRVQLKTTSLLICRCFCEASDQSACSGCQVAGETKAISFRFIVWRFVYLEATFQAMSWVRPATGLPPSENRRQTCDSMPNIFILGTCLASALAPRPVSLTWKAQHSVLVSGAIGTVTGVRQSQVHMPAPPLTSCGTSGCSVS